ncbi:MAG: hypothetical protein ACJA0M_002731, partial [Chitinophagales bacterium]
GVVFWVLIKKTVLFFNADPIISINPRDPHRAI